MTCGKTFVILTGPSKQETQLATQGTTGGSTRVSQEAEGVRGAYRQEPFL